MKKPRGRPRKFDEAAVLDAATSVFWEKGFSGTSLDDLATSMGMNRPSIYAAFGDKETIYRKTLERFCDGMRDAMSTTLFAEADVSKALRGYFRAALDTYTRENKTLGCMVVSTAVCSAPTHPKVQSDLQGVLRSIDDAFQQRLEAAVAEGQLPTGFDCVSRARIVQAILHTLSVRSRAGESKRGLRKLIDSSVALILSR